MKGEKIIMMMGADNKLIADMLAFLGKRGVPAQDCALAERYLNGEVGDEALDQFHRINFASSTVTYEVKNELETIMKGLDRTEKRQTCIRLFHVLFAIGHSTCNALLFYGLLDKIVKVEECGLYKRVVLFVEDSIERSGHLRANDHERLIGIGRNVPDNFRRIIEPLKQEGSRYLLTVLAVYFCMKYGKIGQLAEDDAELMKTYEEELLMCLDEWLSGQLCIEHKAVVDAVREHQLTEELLNAARQCSFAEPARKQLCFIGSMAYLNFPFSDVLRDVVKVCLAVDAEGLFSAFAESSIGTADASRRISISGGDYDELFGIDPETYIRWAAVMGFKHILKRQLVKNQESFLKAMDEDGYQVLLAKKHSTWDSALYAVNQLKDVMKQGNPKLYEQIGASKPNYDQVIQYLVKDGRTRRWQGNICGETLRSQSCIPA